MSYVEIVAFNKERVGWSLEALNKALTLLGKRIEKMPDIPKVIIEILNTDFKTVTDSAFPTILSIGFIQDNKIYSRLGLMNFTGSPAEILS